MDELERRDWDPAWKAHVTANILMQAEAFVFIGFRMKLPYLLKVFKEAGEPRTYMVNPEPYEKFRDDPENPQNAEFLAAFQIGPQRYIQATAREFFEALRPRVHESNLEHQVMVELPRDLQAFGVSRELEPVSEELLNRLKDCQPSEFQRMLKRSLLGSHYIPLASDGTRETLQSLLLLGTAFPIEVARDRSEPVCYLVRNGARHPLFVARSGEKKPYTSMVVALWRNRAENQWPTDLNPLLVQRPLVIIHGQGPLMIPGGLINIADGKGMPGPYGESREFVYLRHDELVGCLNAKNLAATAESVRQLMETRLGGAQA